MSLYVYRCPECPAPEAVVALSVGGVIPACVSHGRPVEMVLLTDSSRALLPLDAVPPRDRPGTALAPLKVEHLKAAGILLPETQDALEWLYRHRERNGMAGAFLKVGGRRCIDLVAFAKLIRERKA